MRHKVVRRLQGATATRAVSALSYTAKERPLDGIVVVGYGGCTSNTTIPTSAQYIQSRSI